MIFEKEYQEICKTYFPRWKPWAYTYNSDWGYGGYTNVERKHIYFGNPTRDLSIKGLIIHEICHAVGYHNHNTRWQKRMMKVAEIAKTHDPEVSAELIADATKYHIQFEEIPGMKEGINWINQEIEDAFLELYSVPGREVNVDTVITQILAVHGILKEWDGKKFDKILVQGRKIAKRQKRIAIHEQRLQIQYKQLLD
jgi:hypothetical protein